MLGCFTGSNRESTLEFAILLYEANLQALTNKKMKESKKFLRTAIGYIRVFNKEIINIYSVEDQREAIEKFAEENEYRILETFVEESKSGKSLDRPAFQRILEYVKSNPWKVKFLIVTDIERLSTSTLGLEKIRSFLKKNGIKIISIVQSMLKYTGKQPKQHR